MSTLAQFIASYTGKSVLYSKNQENRGQCVQLVCFACVEVSKTPVIWADAAEWWYSNRYPEFYERIPNTPKAVPQPGDYIVWDRSLANSGGAGHIAICVQPLPGTGTFISFDSNWGGKTAKLVTHNYTKVVGWLRPRKASNVIAPAPQTQGDEMISNADQATKVYKMLRPNGAPSQSEIDSTAGHRSYVEFINSAQTEVAARDANLRAQVEQLQALQSTINQLNSTITQLRLDMANKETQGAEKAQQLKEAQDKIGELTAQLTTTHDQIVELQNQSPATANDAPQDPAETPTIIDQKAPWYIRLIASLIPKKK